MKKLLLIIALSSFTLVTYAQQVDTAKNKNHDVFCMVISTNRTFSSKVVLTVDYGQGVNGWSDERIKDENGKLATFNSVVDGLNYMTAEGWSFVAVIPNSQGNATLSFSYLMKRRILN